MRHLIVAVVGSLIAGCTSGSSSTPGPVDVDAAWRVRCPGCTYPERALAGPISASDPGDLYADCTFDNGMLDVEFGRATYVDMNQSVPGFSVRTVAAYDPASGFDLSRLCQVQVGEEDSRQWGRACSDSGDCSLQQASLVDGALSFTLRCAAMPAIPAQAGAEADLADGNDPAAAVSVHISHCDL